jgi:Fe-S cluster biogenesis protein NfuA
MTVMRRGSKARATAVLLAGLLAASLALSGCTGAFDSAARQPAGTGAVAAPDQTTMSAPEPGVAEQAAGAAPASKNAAGATTPDATKLVIVTKNMRMTVDKVEGTITKLRALVKRDGGDITALQVSTSGDGVVQPLEGSQPGATAGSSTAPLQATLTLRVPAEKFAAFDADAAKLGRVTFQSENSEDVTQQHVDLKARLRNLRAEEVRLRQFLNKARNVREALDVERELSRVRGEIEAMQAQIDYLERQAAMATVTLELAEPQPIVRPGGQDWGIGDAITTGVQGFVGVINFFIVIVIATAPIWVPATLIAWLVVVLVRRRRRRVAGQTEPAEASADSADENVSPPDDARE